MSPLAPPRPVPNLYGETRIGDTILGMATDTKRVSGFTLPTAQRIVKLSVACDGLGGAAPTLVARMRGVVYQANVLLAVGDEARVTSGDPLAWVDLPFSAGVPGGFVAGAGAVELGAIFGGDGGVLRIAQIDPQAPGGRANADPYVDGPTNPFGTATALTSQMSVFATTVATWTPRPNTLTEIVARLAFPDAQALMEGQTVADAAVYDTTAGWHGTVKDSNKGSFAVVRSAGPLAGLVGKRVRVTSRTHRTRSVIVYVFGTVSDLDPDISLARRAFAALDLLTADSLDVHVEVLG